MSEASKKSPKKQLPKNITELPDTEVAKHLFGKRAAKEIEKIVHPSERPKKHSI